MRRRAAKITTLVAGLAATLAMAIPAPAFAPSLVALDGLTRGNWDLAGRQGSTNRKVCVRAGFELLQLRGDAGRCTRTIIRNSTSDLEVQFSCGGGSQARVDLRVETPSLAQISVQGIADGAPFNDSYEARHTGPCR